jgi:beta-phosphoglucomutase
MTITAVLFDMDGVLIDARDWHYKALNMALEPFGYDISPIDHETRFNGLSTKSKLEILNNEFGFPKDLNEIVNAVKQDRTLRIIAQKCFPIIPHQILLSRLKSCDVKIGVVTNSIRLTAEAMLRHAGVFDFLDILVTNQDVKQHKPDPEGYLLAMKKLKVEPSNTVVIEDSDYGIEAAKAAGCTVIEVDGPENVSLEILFHLIPELLEHR